MENSSLVKLIRKLNPKEKREALKFLYSPFFNQRSDLIALFEWICQTKKPGMPEAWSALHANTPFDESKMRLLMSYLHQLLEQYLIQREVAEDKLGQQAALASRYRKMQHQQAYLKTSKALEHKLETQPLRNADYLGRRYRLLWDKLQYDQTHNPVELEGLKELSDTLDAQYLSLKLRLLCLNRAQQSVYRIDPVLEGEDEMIQMALPFEEEHPAVSIYLKGLLMLRKPGNDQYFYDFKAKLFELTGKCPQEEMHGLYTLAINFCVKKLNTGHQNYFKEVLDLYQEGLEGGYLHENGLLSRFTYHNIVAAALHTGEHLWARDFIHQHKNHLEKKYRESAYSFNLARLEYAQKRHQNVLELLQKANYRDPLLNLAAKTLLLKTYYDLSELDTLQSHLDAMRNYIHRKRIIGYHKRNYLNIVRFMEKLLKIPPGDRKAHNKLLEEIRQETALTEKTYFQNILFDLQ